MWLGHESNESMIDHEVCEESKVLIDQLYSAFAPIVPTDEWEGDGRGKIWGDDKKGLCVFCRCDGRIRDVDSQQ
jgi:hypothetical protein